MKKYAVILGACCFSSSILAENQGIEDTNYILSATASDSDSGNRVSLFGGVRFPVANYLGASVSGRYADFSGKNNYIDSSASTASLGIFLRKYSLGIVSASYSYSRTESAIGDLKNSIKAISIAGTYYVNDFDVGLGRSRADPDSGISSNTSNVSISYYANDNFKVGVSVLRMDADDINAFISYQPKVFRNAASFSVSYLDSEINDTLTVSLAYYFDTKVSLKDRARKY